MIGTALRIWKQKDSDNIKKKLYFMKHPLTAVYKRKKELKYFMDMAYVQGCPIDQNLLYLTQK